MTSPSFPDSPELPPELKKQLEQHAGWYLQENSGEKNQPPYLGPPQLAPTAKTREAMTTQKSFIQSKLLAIETDPTAMDEMTRILQQCADGVSRMLYTSSRWDEKGLKVFLVFDTPTLQLKPAIQKRLPVNTR